MRLPRLGERAALPTTGLTAVSVLAAVSVPALLVVAFVRTAQKTVMSTDLLPLATGGAVAAVVVAVLLGAVPRPRAGLLELLMVAYLGWTLLSTVLPHFYEAVNPITGLDIDLTRLVLTAVVIPFVIYQAARTLLVGDRAVRWLLWTVVAMTAYSAFTAIMQFHGPRWLVRPSFIVEAPSWAGRAVGIFDQPVTNGLMLVLGLVVCLMIADRPETGRRVRIALWAVAAASLYSVYLTHTRAALLALVVAVGLGALLARGWRRGFVAVVVLGVAGLASKGATLLSSDRKAGGLGSSTEIVDRLNIGTTAVHAIADHPWLGVGLGRFAMYNTYEHEAWSTEVDWARGQGLIAHENELAIGADVGLPGVALWLGVLVGVVLLLRRALRDLPNDRLVGRPLAVLAVIALAVMVAAGVTVDLRLLEFTTMLPFALAGAALGVHDRHRPPRAETEDTGDTGDTEDTASTPETRAEPATAVTP